MNTAEIVIRKMQSNSGFQIVQLFRESVGHSGKAPHLHSHGQILPFHIACRDVICIGFSLPYLGYNLHGWAWGVFGFAVVLAIIAIQFYELRKIHVRTKRAFHGVHIESESIRLSILLCQPLVPPVHPRRKYKYFVIVPLRIHLKLEVRNEKTSWDQEAIAR
jgi:hypothetical protein